MKVITVTLNPVLERTLVVHYLALGYHNQTAETTRLAPAGRGVNISRALHNMEVETQAVVLLGDDASGLAYQSLITQEKFPVNMIRVTGQTRSNIVILDTGNKTETSISEDNAGFDMREVDQTAAVVKQKIQPGDFVVYAGPLPAGIPASKYFDLVEMACQTGAKVFLDLPNEGLQEAIKAKPSLVFITQPQMEGYFNYPVRNMEGITYCTQKLCEEGAESVLLLLSDGRGAVLATEDEALLVEFTDIHSGTHSGAVAAMLAGFIAERMKNIPLDRAFKMGAAAALYALEQVGTDFPMPVNLREHLRKIEIVPLPKSEMAQP